MKKNRTETKQLSTLKLLFRRERRIVFSAFNQFLAVILIGAIAVTLFVGLLANADAFENQIAEAYREGNVASLYVTVDNYEEEEEEKLSSFLEEGDQIEKRLYLPGKLGDHEVYYAIYDSSPVISKPYGEREVSPLETSTYFADIDKELASYVGRTYALGDTISLSFSTSLLEEYGYSLSLLGQWMNPYCKEGAKNPFLAEDIELKNTLTGFMNYPENVLRSTYNPSVVIASYPMVKEAITDLLETSFTEEGIETFFSLLYFQFGADFQKNAHLPIANQYLIRLKDEDRVAEVKKKIQDYYARKEENNLSLVVERSEMPFSLTLESDAKQARAFTFVFPFVFFLVALLVILTTLSELVLKDRSEIGTFKALGVKKKDIYAMYILLTLLLVGIGTLIGEILGPLIIPPILGQKYQIIYSLPARKYFFPVWEGILTAFVFLSVSSLVTFSVCHRIVSLSPAEAMRPEAPRFKAKVKKAKKNKLSLAFFMAMRNLRRDKVKSTMVVLGILGCTALLVCGYGIEDTVNYGISYDHARFLNTDLLVSTSKSFSEDELQEKFSSVEEISAFEPFSSKTVTLQAGDSFTKESQACILSSLEGHVKMTFDKDGCALAKKLAESLNVKEGDTIEVKLDGKKNQLRISLIYDAFFFNRLLLSSENSLFQNSRLLYNNAFVDLKDGADPDQAATKLKGMDSVSDAKTQQAYIDLIRNVMSGIFVMTNAVKIFAILLALVVLYNLSLMNFRERTRDIATLKVLGFSRFEIGLTLLWESMALTAIGVACGMLLGYPFLLAVMGTNKVELVYYLYTIYPLTYLYAFLLTFLVALFINLYFTYRTKEIKMVESLKSVE